MPQAVGNAVPVCFRLASQPPLFVVAARGDAGLILSPTMSGLQPSGFAEFDRLADLFRRAHAVLDALLELGELPPGGGDVLADEALPHIEDVEQAFRARLRAAEVDLAELRHLVLQGGLGLPEPTDRAEDRAALVEAMRAISGAGGDRRLVTIPLRRLAALENARLVLAVLPRTPTPHVHYPGVRRSYADIPVPRGPTEFVGRVEEIERTLWRVAAGERPRPGDATYRRVYGFFDVGEQLTAGRFRLT